MIRKQYIPRINKCEVTMEGLFINFLFLVYLKRKYNFLIFWKRIIIVFSKLSIFSEALGKTVFPTFSENFTFCQYIPFYMVFNITVD